MSTHRSLSTPLFCDLGAQYITSSSTPSEEVKDIYKHLRDLNILVPIDVITKGKQIENMRQKDIEKYHFVCPNGLSSIVQHFVGQSDIMFNTKLVGITKTTDQKVKVNFRRIVNGIVEDGEETFDKVVLTLPSNGNIIKYHL